MRVEESVKAPVKAAARFNGTWHNQHKSELKLSVDDNGVVSGTFRPEGKKEFPVLGHADNGVIGFVVVFHGFGSVTSWTGQLSKVSEDNYAETLHTSWHMAVDASNSAEKQLWKAMITGSDNFVRVQSAELQKASQVAASHPHWLNSDCF